MEQDAVNVLFKMAGGGGGGPVQSFRRGTWLDVRGIMHVMAEVSLHGKRYLVGVRELTGCDEKWISDYRKMQKDSRELARLRATLRGNE